MPERTFRIPEHVEFNRVDGDFVLLDLRQGTYFGLDRAASVIWQALAETGDPDHALAQIVARFDIGETQARQDLESLLDDLATRGLLVADRG